MNSMIPLMGRGPQINDPLETAGNAASLQRLLQLNQMGQRKMDEEDAQRAAMQQRMLLAKRSYDEALQAHAAMVEGEMNQRDEGPIEMAPGSTMPGSANSPINQGAPGAFPVQAESPTATGPGAYRMGKPPPAPVLSVNQQGPVVTKPINTTGRMPLTDPKFYEIHAGLLKNYGLDDLADQAMKHRETLLKEKAPQSDIGKMLGDLKAMGMSDSAVEFAINDKFKQPDGFKLVFQNGKLVRVADKEVQDARLREKKAGAANMQMFNNTKDDFKNERDLRNDFKSEPIYKAHSEVKSAYAQIKAGIEQNSPAGDLAAATKFMKILDPTSVVRESELNMAIEASGLGDRAMNLLPRIMSGVKLTPAQRKDFGKLAKEFYDLSEKAYQEKGREYRSIAKDYGLNDRRVGGQEKPSNTWTDADEARLQQLEREEMERSRGN